MGRNLFLETAVYQRKWFVLDNVVKHDGVCGDELYINLCHWHDFGIVVREKRQIQQIVSDNLRTANCNFFSCSQRHVQVYFPRQWRPDECMDWN